ncbi:MAG: hypothetical protein ACI8X3_002829, partial [Saprospiraceae bacterium]
FASVVLYFHRRETQRSAENLFEDPQALLR